MYLKTALLGATAIVSTMSSTANAGCIPSPSVADTISTCSDAEPNGFLLNTSGSQLVVNAGATVSGPTSADGAVIADSGDQSFPAIDTITVNGSIDGSGGPGIRANVAPAIAFGVALPRLSVGVNSGGGITGAAGILVQAGSLVILDNAGTITGTSGPALIADQTSSTSGFTSITNRAGGTIGGLAGQFGFLVNAGTIDGGTGNAIASTAANYVQEETVGNRQVTNSGAIVSTSSAATIDLSTGPSPTLPNSPPGFGAQAVPITNTGTIINRSTGAAINGDMLTITNDVGGQIGTAGSVAIDATELNFVNRGTVTGGVTVTGSTESMIDSTGGTITGNVVLGAGDDIVAASYLSNGSLATGIRGSIDPGGGKNTLLATLNTDTTLSSGVALPTGFQTLGLSTASGVTTTLANGFSVSGGLVLAGAGTVDNGVALSATSISTPTFGSQLTFRNSGSITASTLDLSLVSFSNGGSINLQATSAQPTAMTISADLITNSGTIAVDAASLDSSGATISLLGPATNTGAIHVAGGGGVTTLADFTNVGRIETDGTALTLRGGGLSFPQLDNNGTIVGTAAGVSLVAGSLLNTETIRSAGTGIVVTDFGFVTNAAGATLSGDVNAIAATNVTTMTIDNNGLISGNVVFGSGGGTFTAETGSRLAGNLDLGSGQATFVTDIVNTGPGQFAHVDGTISGTGTDTILYRVTSSQTAILAPAGLFDIVGYQLQNGAKLTIGSGDFALPVAFTGTGSVDVSANISDTDTSLITSSVDLVSRGTLALVTDNGAAPAAISSGDAVDNEGTIEVTDTAPGSVSRTAAVTTTGTFTNNSIVTLTQAVGSLDSTNVINNGTITSSPSDVLSRGVIGSQSLANSGTIATGGDAVLAYGFNRPGIVTNSGTISSQHGMAVVAPISPLTFTNTATGTIAGGAGQAAIFFASGSSITNDGVINGDLVTAYDSRGFFYQDGNYHRLSTDQVRQPGSPPPSGGDPTRDTTILNRGTINGSVVLLSGSDVFANAGQVTGTVSLGYGNDSYVSLAGDRVAAGQGGTVDGGAGTDTIELHTTNGTASAPTLFAQDRFTGFERLVQAEGVTAIGGSASYDTITVNGGELVGLAGSTLTAADGISIASGGRLSPAGRLVGAVTVTGLLAPGTATATVAGAVAFQPGSALALTIGATNGRLDVTGPISIASGATLALTADSASIAGKTLQLVSATGGITGTFTLAPQTPLAGFLAQTSTGIDLVGAFQPLAGSTNAAAAVATLNRVLSSGQASSSLLAAAPGLITGDGTSDAASFARTTPEAYAATDWMTLQDGIALSRLSRSGALGTSSPESRPYLVAEGFGGSLRLGSNATLGSAGSTTTNRGMIAGIGIGSRNASLAVFGGYRHDNQSLSALGASSSVNGGVAGLAGTAKAGRLQADAIVAYLWGNAHTRRDVPGGAPAMSSYRLDGLVTDGTLRYVLPVGRWAILPSIGLIYVGSDRSAVVEQGSPAFDLRVFRRGQDHLLFDGGIKIASQSDGAIKPWISVGVRRVLLGDGSTASAAFVGTDPVLTVAASGLAHTQALAGAGLDVKLGHRVDLNVHYDGMFGSRETAYSVSGGIRAIF